MLTDIADVSYLDAFFKRSPWFFDKLKINPSQVPKSAYQFSLNLANQKLCIKGDSKPVDEFIEDWRTKVSRWWP